LGQMNSLWVVMKVLIRIGMGGRGILMAMVMGRVHTGVSLVSSSYSATI